MEIIPVLALVSAHPDHSVNLSQQWTLCAKCLFVANMEWMQKNSAKSVILPHKQNKQCFWQKIFFFPAHCVFFSMSSLQTHERRHWWASNVTQTLFECEERRKNQNQIIPAQGRKMFAVLASYNASFMSVRWVEWVSRLLVLKLIYRFLDLVQLQRRHREWIVFCRNES